MKILTQEVLRKDGPLFEFVLHDEPYPLNNWNWYQPRETEVAPFCFLEFGEAIMEQMYHLFMLNGEFDQYDVTNFHADSELQCLMGNIEIEVAGLLCLDRETFLGRFGSSLNYLADINNLEHVAGNWEIARSDFIQIFRLIGQKALIALQEGKTLSIVGI